MSDQLVLTLKRSPYGWSAYHPNGSAVAHSKERSWLEEYCRDAGAEVVVSKSQK